MTAVPRAQTRKSPVKFLQRRDRVAAGEDECVDSRARASAASPIPGTAGEASVP